MPIEAEKNKIIQVGIVENEERYRARVQEMLALHPRFKLATWNSAEEFWRDPGMHSIDILLVDIGLPHMNGIDLVTLVNERFPDMKMIMLTSMASEELIFKSLKQGALGFVYKDDVKNLLEVLEVVLTGGAVITPTIALRIQQALRHKDNGEYELTARERQILDEVIHGSTLQRAADVLGISHDTARFHLRNVYKKLNVSNRVELARRANEMGLL